MRLQEQRRVRRPQGEVFEYTADFDNIGGLKSRAPVKSAGVVVGRVPGEALRADEHPHRPGAGDAGGHGGARYQRRGPRLQGASGSRPPARGW